RLSTKLLQIEPGAERAARSREDEHVDVAGARQVHEGVAQGLAQLAREGVQRLRAIEGERGDAVDHLDEQHGLRHGEARSTRRAVVSAGTGRKVLRTLPLAEAKATLSKLVTDVATTDEEVTITRNGRAAAVLVSVEEFERWRETAGIMSDPRFLAEIRRG